MEEFLTASVSSCLAVAVGGWWGGALSCKRAVRKHLAGGEELGNGSLLQRNKALQRRPNTFLLTAQRAARLGQSSAWGTRAACWGHRGAGLAPAVAALAVASAVSVWLEFSRLMHQHFWVNPGFAKWGSIQQVI